MDLTMSRYSLRSRAAEAETVEQIHACPTQLTLDDDPVFCPLVIDMCRDSEQSESSCIQTRATRRASHPQPNVALNMCAALPDDRITYSDCAMSQYSSTSSSDSFSSKTPTKDRSELSNKLNLSSSKQSGKGSAPCKTRRKGDRILPIGVDEENGAETFICPVCQEVLLTLADLTRHIRSHNTGSAANSNTCTICNKILSSQSSLDRHMLVHSGERPFTCNVCKMTFTTNGNMHRHMRIHEKELASGGLSSPIKDGKPSRTRKDGFTDHPVKSGSKDGVPPQQYVHEARNSKRKGLDGLSAFPASKRIQSTTVINVPIVSVNSTDARSVSSHKQTDTAVVSGPGDCKERLSCEVGLKRHVSDEHREMEYVCPHCTLVCDTPARLHSHMIIAHSSPHLPTHSKPSGFQNLDYMAFSSNKFVEVARVYCEKNQQESSSLSHTFRCHRCQYSFPSKAILRLHLDTHAPESTSTCSICDCTFISRQAYKNHVAKHSQSRIISAYTNQCMTGVQQELSQEDFMLVLGLQSSTTDSPLLSEYRDMSINTTYYANIPAMITDQKHAALAIKQEHPIPKVTEKSKPMKSQSLLEHLQAPTTWKSAQVLLTPLESQLRDVKLSTNSILGSVLINKNNSIVKREVISSESYPDDDMSNNSLDGSAFSEDLDFHVCKYCDENFATHRALKAHERSHLGMSPYQCNLCHYTSTDKSTLVRHLRTHNGDRPYHCLLCEFAFTTKANCERHVRNRHDKQTKSEIEASIGYSEYSEENLTERTTFTSPDTICMYCGVDFKYFRSLKHHLRSNGSCHHKPYVCKLCSQGFSTKANCMRHIQKQHTHIRPSQIEGNILSSNMPDEVKHHHSVANNLPPLSAGIVSEEIVKPHNSPMLLRRPYHPSTFITTPPVDDILPDMTDSGFDQPLDFSMKSLNRQATSQDLDTPMDLSISKPCPASVTQLPQANGGIRANSLLDDCGSCELIPEQNNNKTCYQEAARPTLRWSTVYNSDSELASVTKMLDAANTMRLKPFLKEQPPTPPAGQQPPTTPAGQPPPTTPAGRQPPTTPAGRSRAAQFLAHKSRAPCSSTEDIHDQRSVSPDSEVSESNSYTPPPTDLVDSDADRKKRKRNSYSDSPHKLQCPYCPRAFPWISSLKRHILTHTGQKPFKCPQCPVTFSTKSNRERHMVRKHGLDVHDPATRQMMDRPFKCHMCVFSSFSTPSNLLKHYKERHPEREMPQQLASSLAAHQAMNGMDNVSDAGDNVSTASDISTSSNALLLQAYNDDDDDDDDEDMIEDSMAQKSRNVDTDVRRGKTRSHSTSPGTPPEPAPHSARDLTPDRHINPERDNYNVDKITDCWKCGVAFPSRKDLLRHLKEHNIDHAFKCYLCDASFDNRQDSVEHTMRRHAADWDVVKEKNKITDYESFCLTQEQLVQEALSGGLHKNPDMLDEAKIDTDYAQRKVYCSLCTKRFWSLQDLRRHMRSHTGERPFECEICQARFTLKHSMMRHRRKHSECGSGLSDEETASCHDNTTARSMSVSRKQHSVDAADGDLLHDLLGVETDALDKMLDSVDSAATLLGVHQSSKAAA